MLLSLYHIVNQSLKNSEIYYLAKSIRIEDKVYKIRINIGKTEPPDPVKEVLMNTPNLELEKKALEKRVELAPNLYDSKYLNMEQVKRLERVKYWEHFFTLFLSKSELDYVTETSRIEYIHGTTAIEGNTFSIQQVDELLNRRIVPASKSLREINEVQNYLSVEKYLDEYSGKVTLRLVCKLHELIMDNIDLESAGVFRKRDSIGIRGVDIAVAPAILIEDEVLKIIDEYYEKIQQGGHTFEEAALFHYKFEAIHPFNDGNGRVGRSILNYMLEKTGFPRIIISDKIREQYLSALQYGNKNDYRNMLKVFLGLLEDDRVKLFNEILKR